MQRATAWVENDNGEIVVAERHMSYGETYDYMTFAITYYYIRFMRRIAFKLLGHVKKIERMNNKNVREYISACM